ncbi:hypothetical protein B0H16DRAFT_1476793 [Mycena metata]|uniref:Uncharacterized protein n=1 Tax=Mycena metata TaxID=1033252 RepID=A0AAD7HAJ1_9AGAR|nr:hypothetical protein B0H16DRAFT_1476793 [Mycena metata]
MTKKRRSKKPSPQKASNDSKEYKPGLSKEEKAERRRKLSAESYARRRPEITERRRIAAAAKRAKKRCWDPAPKPAITPPPAPSSLPSSSIDGSLILPQATPSEYHRAWFDGLSEEPPSLSARSLSLWAAAADVAKAGDIAVTGGDHISLTSDEMVATQVLAGMAQLPKKFSPAPSFNPVQSISSSSSGRLSLPRSTDRCVLLRPTVTTAPGITRVGLGQALVAELNSGALTAPNPDDAARWRDHGEFAHEEDWRGLISWQNLRAWRKATAAHILREQRTARAQGQPVDEDLYLG